MLTYFYTIKHSHKVNKFKLKWRDLSIYGVYIVRVLPKPDIKVFINDVEGLRVIQLISFRAKNNYILGVWLFEEYGLRPKLSSSHSI